MSKRRKTIYTSWSMPDPAKNYVPLPKGIYRIGLSGEEIAIYGYLFSLENESYQCWPNYETIGKAVHMSKRTVMKYVSLLEEKGYDPLVYRLFCLGSHYRKSLVFSWDALDNAAQAYGKLAARIAAIDPEDGELDGESFAKLKSSFTDALDSDLNTSLAITALYDVLKADINGRTKYALIEDFDRVLSLGLLEAAKKQKNTASPSAADSELDAKIRAMIDERAEAKKAKNYARAVEIRAELTAMGVTLTDTKDGTTYKIG